LAHSSRSKDSVTGRSKQYISYDSFSHTHTLDKTTENINHEQVSESWLHHVSKFNPQPHVLNTMN